MEASQMAKRCVRQIIRSSNGCRRPLSNGQSKSSITNLGKPTCLSYRTFTSTATSRLGESSDETRSPPNNSNEAVPPQESSTTARTQQDRPKRPSRDGGRIDLSTIPGMPSSYKPPARPDEATAQAKLRSLLGAAAASQKQSPSASGANHENDYPTSSLDAYTSSSPTGRRTTPALDLASLIEDLDKPRHGGGHYGDSLSPLNADQPVEVLRLRPTLGRTVNVTPATGFDLTRAFRQLEIKCNVNSVKRDEIKQRFHVRRGQRRKLDRSARWRVLFKEGFIAECARIRRMRAQGW